MENDKSNITFETLKQLIEFYNIDVGALDLEKLILEGQLKEHSNKEVQPTEAQLDPVSEKLIHQMEERIAELKSRNEELEMRLRRYE